MNARTIVLLIVVVLIGLLAALNWSTLATPSLISLGVTTVEAPLGVLMLCLTILLGVFFVAYVLSLQGSVLMETRKHAKEMTAQRELADKAEASRFTQLREFLLTQQSAQQAALLERMDALESRMATRLLEIENSTAAEIGQLEDQLRKHPPAL
jgi:uncharacterized membrane protein (DUF485 family)